jgi:hypothetical protein
LLCLLVEVVDAEEVEETGDADLVRACEGVAPDATACNGDCDGDDPALVDWFLREFTDSGRLLCACANAI